MYVLRTGAYSFQGDLRRTIDFGSHGIRDESKDAGVEREDHYLVT